MPDDNFAFTFTAPHDHTSKLRRTRKLAAWNRTAGRCWFCGAVLEHHGMRGGEPYRCHLYTPGLDTPENRVPACLACHKAKGERTAEEFRADFFAIREIVCALPHEPISFWFEEFGYRGDVE